MREYVSQLEPEVLFELGTRVPCTREVRLRQLAYLFVELEDELMIGTLDAVTLRVEGADRLDVVAQVVDLHSGNGSSTAVSPALARHRAVLLTNKGFSGNAF